MKTNRIIVTAVALALAGAFGGANAAAATLKVGDATPKLQTGKWVQGEPVKQFEPGKAYIVEFWATWCGPCRVSIPHLNEVHNRFKDKGLIVIGQDVWEKNEAEVPKFIKQMGNKMTYRVALDDKTGSEKGKMAETWMEAAAANGIPTAFVVDKQGKIAWIGHPMELKDQIIEQVLGGTFDLKKAAAAYTANLLNKEKLDTLWRKLNASMQKKEWTEAESTLAEAEKLLPEDNRDGLAMTRFQILLGKRDFKSAYKLAEEVSDTHKDNPMMQNALAWTMITDDRITEPNLDLAEKIAARANHASKGTDPGIIDTVARVHFMKGEKQKAMELQQKAVELAEGRMKTQFQETLDSYKAGKLPKGD